MTALEGGEGDVPGGKRRGLDAGLDWLFELRISGTGGVARGQRDSDAGGAQAAGGLSGKYIGLTKNLPLPAWQGEIF